MEEQELVPTGPLPKGPPRGNVWWVDGQGAYLQRCPACEEENYTMAVPSGVCYRCRYNANQYPACQYPRPQGRGL